MPDKVTLYDLVKKWLPEERTFKKEDWKIQVSLGDILYVENSILTDIKQRLEKIEVSDKDITDLIENNIEIWGEGGCDSKGCAQAILNYLRGMGKE